MLYGCKNKPAAPSNCVKGKFTGTYCDGLVIQVLDKHAIGKDWKGIDNKLYKNSVVANLDTNNFARLFNSVIFPKDSIFYFLYRDGGYPRASYNLCEPSAYIIVTSIAGDACP